MEQPNPVPRVHPPIRPNGRGLGALAMGCASAPTEGGAAAEPLRASDVQAFLRSEGEWVDWAGGHTCDGFKYGEPEREVRGIAVAWMATMANLQQAADLGCTLFVTHEPTFYAHMDDDPAMLATPEADRKRALLDAAGITVVRCHDLWDRYPQLGIVDSWAAWLGLERPPLAHDGYHAVFGIGARTAGDVGRQVLERTRPLGQETVDLVGDPEQIVHRLGIGCGAITDVRHMVELGADGCLVTDDGFCYWARGSWLLDRGTPALVVNHAVAEEPGMRNLAQHLQQRFPQVKTKYLQTGSLRGAIGAAPHGR